MASTRRTRTLLEILKGYLYCLVCALGFAYVMSIKEGQPIKPEDVTAVLIISTLFTGIIIVVFVVVVQRTRHLSFFKATIVRFAAYLIGELLALVMGVALNSLIFRGPHYFLANTVRVLADTDFRYAYYFAPAATLVFLFLAGISQKLGPGTLRSWILGRYHEPRIVERIFMFLDLKDSTKIAESLGDLQYSRLIQEFFSDITTPVLDHRAEVSHFIGDEVVLTWRMRPGLENANCIRCFFAIRDEIERRADHYRDRYGLVPSFKAGAHCGQVVATEVGDIKSEIVYHGDVLNTASRLQGLCREEGADFLISGTLANLLPELSQEFSLESIGEREMKGKAKPISVYCCSSKSLVQSV